MTNKSKTYSNLVNSYPYWNAWRPEFTFPTSALSDTFLSKIQVEEITYLAESKNSDVFKDIAIELNRISNHYAEAILFSFGHQVAKKTKLRSFKGLLYEKKESLKEYSEAEFSVDEKNSVLGASINLRDIDNVEQLMTELPNTYILVSREKRIWKHYDVNLLMSKTLYLDDSQCYIDYYQTLKFWLTNKNLELIRIGGNGNSEVSIQKFGQKVASSSKDQTEG